jgi:hypothetical protein
MSNANKRIVLGVAVGLWLAASVLAISLVHELNRPLHDAGGVGGRVAPFVIALLAVGWLGFTSIGAGWGPRVVRQSQVIYARMRHP